MDAVWPGTFVTESSLLEAIGLLRDALGDDRRQPTYIQTVHRRGYRFIGYVAPTSGTPGDLRDLQVTARRRSTPAQSPGGRSSSRAPPTRSRRSASRSSSRVFGQHPLERRDQPLLDLAAGRRVDRSARAARSPSRSTASRLVYVGHGVGPIAALPAHRSIATSRGAIAGTDDASDPFFSPDGEWIGFFARGSLQKVRVDGGMPIVLVRGPRRRGRDLDRRRHDRLWRRPRRWSRPRQRIGGSRSIGAPDDRRSSLPRPSRLARASTWDGPMCCPAIAASCSRRSPSPAATSACSICRAARAHASPSKRRSRATRRPGTSSSSGRAVSKRRAFR